MDSTKRESIQKLILLIDENYQIGSNTDTDVKNDTLKYLLEQLKEYKPKEEPKPEPVVQKIYIQPNEPRCNNNSGEVNRGRLLFDQLERQFEMEDRNRNYSSRKSWSLTEYDSDGDPLPSEGNYYSPSYGKWSRNS